MRPTEPLHLQARIKGLSSFSSGHQQKRQFTYSSVDLNKVNIYVYMKSVAVLTANASFSSCA